MKREIPGEGSLVAVEAAASGLFSEIVKGVELIIRREGPLLLQPRAVRPLISVCRRSLHYLLLIIPMFE